jgi:hypothetical protein
MSQLNAIAKAIGVSPSDEDDREPAPFVPQTDVHAPAAERFLGVAKTQYSNTRASLYRTAEQLEAKAAELRERAKQLETDFYSLQGTVLSAVKYEDECRGVAQSLSLVRPVEG